MYFFILGLEEGIEIVIKEIFSPYRKTFEYFIKDEKYRESVIYLISSIVGKVAKKTIDMHETIKIEKRMAEKLEEKNKKR